MVWELTIIIRYMFFLQLLLSPNLKSAYVDNSIFIGNMHGCIISYTFHMRTWIEGKLCVALALNAFVKKKNTNLAYILVPINNYIILPHAYMYIVYKHLCKHLFTTIY